MPLAKSSGKLAFAKNVAAELKAGRPKNQALAIAFATQRKAKKVGK